MESKGIVNQKSTEETSTSQPTTLELDGGTRPFNYGHDGAGFNLDFPLDTQECCAIWKAAKHFDQLHELEKSFETIHSNLCQQYQENTLSMEGASMVVQSLVQHGLITWEYGRTCEQHDKEGLNLQCGLGHADSQSTLRRDSFDSVKCHFQNSQSDMHSLQASLNGGTRPFNFRDGFNLDFPLGIQECCAIWKAAKHFDQLHELEKSFETTYSNLCQQYQENTLSMEGAAMVVQSLVQHGLITWEHGWTCEWNDKEHLNLQCGLDKADNQSTPPRDSFDSMKCHFQKRQSDMQSLQASFNSGARPFNYGSGSNLDFPLGIQECRAIWKAAKHFDQLHELEKSFETIHSNLCLQYQENTLSMEGAAMVVQSLVQHGLITWEHGWTCEWNDKEHLNLQCGLDKADNQSTLPRDSFDSMKCHFQKRQSDMQSLQASFNSGARPFNYGGGSNLDFPLGIQECRAIWKAAKHFDQLHELEKSFETIHSNLCLQYQENTLSMEGASMVLQSLVQHGLITWEYGWTCERNDREHLNLQCGLDQADIQSTLPRDSFDSVKCHFQKSQSYMQSLQASLDKSQDVNGHNCKVCGRVFKWKGELENHELIHVGLRPYECEKCGKRFSRKGNLKTHMLTHSNIRLFECEVCSKTFTQKSSLKRHFSTHSNIRPHGKTFTQKDSLKTHMLTHLEDRTYECEVCGETFPLLSSLKTHLLTHSNIGPYECKDCGETFTQNDSLKTHMLTHFEIRPYECEVCGETFTWLRGLKTHFLTHSNIKPHECQECDKIFTQKGSLETHMLTHLQLRPYECDVCRRRFTQKSSLKTHLSSHSMIRQHECDECGNIYTHKGILKIHMLTHLKMGPHECEVCGITFPLLSSLKTHFLTHSNIKPHECQECGKIFTQKGSLETHMLTHLQLRPHECEVCRRRFSRKSSLNTHLLIHSNTVPPQKIRQHECEQCGKIFTDKDILKIHMLTHLKMGPHECEVCGKTFPLLSSIKTHFLTHSNIRPHECQECGKIFTQKSSLETHMHTHLQLRPHECEVCRRRFTLKNSLIKRHIC
ncbi:zinc finger protein 665-like isoform X2 [Ptychodera flava]|uniref:zinc finger protein 665-like isoform X2 n=1 Tax=Ptychodera flava TaxID=63121 RepID=UPI003969CD5B